MKINLYKRDYLFFLQARIMIGVKKKYNLTFEGKYKNVNIFNGVFKKNFFCCIFLLRFYRSFKSHFNPLKISAHFLYTNRKYLNTFLQ